jgi:hypothetical protein
MDETVYPWLIGINEEFCLVTQELPCQNGGTMLYPAGFLPFPDRCYGRNLREIKYKDVSNNLYNCPLANLDDRDLFQRNPNLYTNFMGAPAIYVEGDSIGFLAATSAMLGTFVIDFAVKVPTLSSSTTLQGDIINLSYAAGTTTITVRAPGADFNTAFPIGQTKRADLYRRTSGSYLNIDILVARGADVGGHAVLTTTKFTSDELENFKQYQSGGGFGSIASYTPSMVILPADTNNYIPVPQELDNYTVIALSARYLEATGDTEGLGVTQVKMKEAEAAAARALAKRVTGECKVFSNRRGIRSYFSSGFIRRY